MAFNVNFTREMKKNVSFERSERNVGPYNLFLKITRVSLKGACVYTIYRLSVIHTY